jgi:large subunit ribosomal protein L15
MKLNELKPQDGSTKKRMRVGRGIGSSKGKTAGRGVKGQKARTGVSIKGFEGGQMPLHRRLPKRGFKNIFAVNRVEVTLGRLQAAVDAKKLDAKGPIDADVLVKAGVIRRKKDGVKLVNSGKLTAKLDLTVAGATKGALDAVEKAGGKVSLIPAKVNTLATAARKGRKGPKSRNRKENDA